MEMQKRTPRGQRVVLVPTPCQEHINPMLQLGTFLHSKGFSITIIHTHFNSPSPSNHPEFTFIPIQDCLTVPLVSSGNIIAILLALNANCKASFEQCLTTQVMKQEPEKITCIYDEFMYFSEAAANYLNIPSIILRTTSAANFHGRSTVVELHSKGHIPFPDQMHSKCGLPSQGASSTRRLVVYAGASILAVLATDYALVPLPVLADDKSNGEEEKDGVLGAIQSLLETNTKTKSGRVLPKAYLKTAKEVVKTLRESVQEDPKDKAKFRRTADAAKESI
ncbi:UDP-glucose iridoid glucosyltransferase [Rosa chinensis]|nr:UDP-glucose iridoid glucosyltransferase [Rosa chinensis]